MQLFGSFTSPYVRHCRILAKDLNLNVELVETDYGASAKNSPAMRVPYFEDGEIKLTDSMSIIKYLCEKAESNFLTTAREFDQFALVNTAMDSCINLFLLERDKITPENSAYLKRQESRINALLTEMNGWGELNDITSFEQMNHVHVRLACFLNWALFRKRIQLHEFDNLKSFEEKISAFIPFSESHPSKAK